MTFSEYEKKYWRGATEAEVKSTKDWIEQFNNIPQQILSDLIESGAKDYYEVYTPLYHVTCKMLNDCGNCKHADDITPTQYTELYEDDEQMYIDCGESYQPHYLDKVLAQCEMGEEQTHEDEIPMWGTLVQPPYMDQDWFKSNAQEIYEKVGLLVYENEYYTIMIGANSAGHDFYQSYWVPLYKLRGLKWHE